VVKNDQGNQLNRELALAEWAEIHPPKDESPDEIDIDADDAEGFAWGKLKTKHEALVAGEKARLLHMERLEIEGRMHRTEDVEAAWSEIVMSVRAKLLALPGDVAGAIGVKLKKDRIAVQQIIEWEINKMLLELSGDVQVKIQENRIRRTAKRSK
jgi:hypothetical protein